MDDLHFGLTPVGPIPNERQREWFDRGMTAFLHFGMNTFTDREWGDGTEDPALFNPTELDCRQWIRVLKEAGFGCAILTAKHHDGFCLWPSAYTEHSVKNSPYRNGKGDIVREFTDACREFGMKAGLYLSPWDRHEPTWGSEAYNDFYVGQLTELLTQYGPVWEVWWDGAGSTEAVYDWTRWGDTVRALQPRAVIFGSLGAAPYVDVRWVGNEVGVAGRPCWGTVHLSSLEREVCAELNRGDPEGSRYIPAEADVSIRPGWFYHSHQDGQVRSVKNLMNLWYSSLGRNAGFLLNIPPDRRGLIHEKDEETLREFHRVLSEGFGENLAQKAVLTAPEGRCGECDAAALLRADSSFYAPGDGCLLPEIHFDFDAPVEFDAFLLGEEIGLGHRITSFTLSALTEGGWQELFSGSCVGHLCAERFDPVVTSSVRLTVTGARAVPALRQFGLYRMAETVDPGMPAVTEDLLRNPSAALSREGNTVEIQLGGIFPFNRLRMDGTYLKEYEVRIFNGTDFEFFRKEKVLLGEPVDLRFDTVDWAYRLQILLTEHPRCDITDRRIRLYCEHGGQQ